MSIREEPVIEQLNRRLSPWLAVCLAVSGLHAGDEIYELGPDSQRQDGVPRGRVTEHVFKSAIFPDTIRRYWVYVPSQHDGETPAALMVFQDGHAYVGETGQFRAPIVFDNLIHRADMPVTVGVFVDPGHKKETLPDQPGWRPQPENRSFEYDTLSDQYARFLLDELLPEVGKAVHISDDPERRAICGISSGGICAWTVAWERPDSFRKVLSHVGSFTNIRGGHVYPALIRKAPPKPIRVYLQDGTGDLDNEHGSWYLANRQMAAALRFAKYDHLFVVGEGRHSGKHGGAVLPDALRWLWRESGSTTVVARDAKLELLAGGCVFTEGPAVDATGNVYFTDQPNDRILRWSIDGKLSTFKQPAGRSNGLYFDRDGNLLACADEKNQLWSIDRDGNAEVLVKDWAGKLLNGPNDLWIDPVGAIWFTDPFYRRRYWKRGDKEQDGECVYRLAPDRRTVTRVAEGLVRPNGIVGTPDGRTLYVADIGDKKTYRWTIRPEGTLTNRKLFAPMGSDGMTIDVEGNVYLTGKGVTVFGRHGRKVDHIAVPKGWTANVCFGGVDRSTLFITAQDSLFAIRTRVRGVR